MKFHETSWTAIYQHLFQTDIFSSVSFLAKLKYPWIRKLKAKKKPLKYIEFSPKMTIK